jgi:hypothetical protein
LGNGEIALSLRKKTTAAIVLRGRHYSSTLTEAIMKKSKQRQGTLNFFLHVE